MKLIASWTKDQDASMDEPHLVKWGDGTPATLEDYKKHLLDTHTIRFDGSGRIERHTFPDLVAEVSFDRAANDWVVRGPGVATAALELNDANAKDEEIVAELYTFPIVYRVRILRSAPNA
jgi:hypothetical protein